MCAAPPFSSSLPHALCCLRQHASAPASLQKAFNVHAGEGNGREAGRADQLAGQARPPGSHASGLPGKLLALVIEISQHASLQLHPVSLTCRIVQAAACAPCRCSSMPAPVMWSQRPAWRRWRWASGSSARSTPATPLWAPSPTASSTARPRSSARTWSTPSRRSPRRCLPASSGRPLWRPPVAEQLLSRPNLTSTSF